MVAPGTAYGGPENKYDGYNSNRNSAGLGHHGAAGGYVEPAHQSHHHGAMGDVPAQGTYTDIPGTHLEPAAHGSSRYEAEKYREPLHV